MKHIRLILIVASVLTLIFLVCCNSKLYETNAILEGNIKVLYSNLEEYKVNDSLNVVTIAELQFTKKELLQRCGEDKKLIEQLSKNSKLQSYKKIEVIKHDTIRIYVRDTIYYNKGEPDSAKVFSYDSKWTSIKGTIVNDSLDLSITNKEDLIITERLQKKKFWFIKLPIEIFGYKNKCIDVVSKNPNTCIQSVEYINIRD